jgi:CPA1 family monovalent cation:H+ antiporter
MSAFQIAAILLVIAALISYINERFLKLPGKTGHFLLGLGFALAVILGEQITPFDFLDAFKDFVGRAGFSEIMINVFTGVLLFAAGLHLPLRLLEENRRTFISLAFIVTFLNTVVIGILLWALAMALPFNITIFQALAFGALISPTDPLTALAILEKIGLPERLRTIFVSESLFNDGIGIVLFTIFSGIAFGGQDNSWIMVLELLSLEVVGGVVAGLALAWINHYMVRTTDDIYTHIIVTLASVAGGYAAALALDISGPIAMALFGMIAGNYTFETKIPRAERQDVHKLWTILDDIITSVLFVLIGLQLVRIPIGFDLLLITFAAIPVVLASRFVSIFGALNIMSIERPFSRMQFGVVSLLTWGGLRGGLSIAMAYALPQEAAINPIILDMTFAVVSFSIIAQGLTIKRFFSAEVLQNLSREQARSEK